jgi:hypothetical protein
VLWLFNLWNLLQGRSVSELRGFEQGVAGAHAIFYDRAGFRYLGAYCLSEEREADAKAAGEDDASALPFSHAYVYLVDASSPKEGQDRIEARPLTDAMETAALERRSLNDTAGARAQLWLQPIILSTEGKMVESVGLADGDVILLRLQGPASTGRVKEEARGRTARRAVARYAEMIEAVGLRYLGTYRALGLQEYSMADIHVARASSPGEAVARMDALRVSQPGSEVVAEYAERGGAGTGRAAAAVWFSPLAIPPPIARRR